MRTLLVLLVALALGCGRGRGGPADGDPADRRRSTPPPAGLALADVRVLDPDGDERLEPRFGRGERLQIALAARPLAPPLAAVVRVLQPDGTLLFRDEPRRVLRGSAVNAPWAVPITLPVAAPPGAYRLEATVTDARGQRAVARVRIEHVGDEVGPASAPAASAPAAASRAATAPPARVLAPPARVLAPPAPVLAPPARRAAPPARRAAPRGAVAPTLVALRLRDAAGLPRGRFARSERATIEVEVGGAGPGDALRLRLAGPEGVFEDREGVVPADAPAAGAGVTVVQQPARVPPFGAPGPYRLSATLSRGGVVVATRELALEVVGRPLAAPASLAIEASVVAGQWGRRVAVLEGGQVRVRVRVAGFATRPAGAATRVEVSAWAVLRRPDGVPIGRARRVGGLEGEQPYHPTRVELQGDVELPRSPPGDFILELEARDALAERQVTALRHVSIP